MCPADSSIHQFLFVEPNDLCLTKTYSPLLMWRCPEMDPTVLQASVQAVPVLCHLLSLLLQVQQWGCVLYKRAPAMVWREKQNVVSVVYGCPSKSVYRIFQREKKTVSSVLKPVTWSLSFCCEVKGKACIQNCREVSNNVDQHNEYYSAERKSWKSYTTNLETKCLLVSAVEHL